MVTCADITVPWQGLGPACVRRAGPLPGRVTDNGAVTLSRVRRRGAAAARPRAAPALVLGSVPVGRVVAAGTAAGSAAAYPPITRCLAARTWPCWDGLVPETAEQTARRKRAAYEAARRRSAVTLLGIAECTCRYGASQLSNGASPAEAAATMAFVTGELAEVAAALRRLERLTPAQRQARAAQLTALGMTREEVGRRLGVSSKSVRKYLRAQAPELIRPSPSRLAR